VTFAVGNPGALQGIVLVRLLYSCATDREFSFTHACPGQSLASWTQIMPRPLSSARIAYAAAAAASLSHCNKPRDPINTS